ncbi:thrombospondin type-1 domain-containing protein 4 [Gouania willdenowi]|uniref:thrombospondin type-1 domain-containing protein 4 n=1 Tax=Gouania willdenowi TaxID=441366 RepID=UPI0010568BBD|nr:thrombospondin type-1 domain-containing protein 4-like [Gouania willdenowi]
MAGLRQHPFSQKQGRALAFFHFIWFLSPNSDAVPFDTKAITNSVQGFEVIKGNFSRSFLRVGYHKIAEIPAGAFNISIKETIKSRNYLALKTKSGTAIINGNWVIDRPGFFVAVGTMLTYQRPNEIRSRKGESITAPGPLTEELHVYLIYQQPGPRLYFEYSIPLETQLTSERVTYSYMLPLAEETHLSDPDEKLEDDKISNNEIIEETPLVNQGSSNPNTHSEPQPSYSWKKSGHTPCSATCGSGKHQVLWECVEKDSLTIVPADLCDTEPTNHEEVCSTQACPAYWDVGEWSECIHSCGPSTQHRQVICRQVTHVLNDGMETSVSVASEQCGLAEMPVTKSTCQLKICSQWEVRSDWSPCSVPCGVGQRSREVVCVSNQGDVEDEQECNMNLKPDVLQNCDMGVCARSWFTSLWSQRCSAECGRGNRTRVVVCLMDHVTDLPLDSCEGERPSDVISCDSGLCQNQLKWYAGPWGQCSVECGNGTQTRSLACVFHNNGLTEVVDPPKCSGIPKPITAQPCRLKPCGIQWFVTEWSECSLPCNSGYRIREVRCLTDNIVPSDECDPKLIPESREECNKQPCTAEINQSCIDQYYNCLVVVQARLCIYPYYRRVCCASCDRAQKSYPSSFQKNHIRR